MAVCKTCGSIVQPGNSFCPVCGQGLFDDRDALICSECNTPNAPGTRFCKNCGAVLLKKPKTVQCPVCGSENAEDAFYCTSCGSELPGTFEKEFEVESIEKLKEIIPLLNTYADTFTSEFDKLSPEELKSSTYVCPVCGKRNYISDIKCRRCGRDKNRSAYLAGKQRIPAFEEAVEVLDKPLAPLTPAPVVPPKNEMVHGYFKGKRRADSTPAGRKNNNSGYAGGYAGFMGGEYGQEGIYQNNPIVQPLAIVPYVTQEQPLWQCTSREEYDKNHSSENSDK